MTILNPDKLADCDKRILVLADRLEGIAKDKYQTSLVLHSGKRNGGGKSWHDQGKALDFSFKDINVFKLVSELYYLCAGQEGAFKGVTEFEVVRGVHPSTGDWQNHLHIAYGDESKLETFTSDYSKVI